VILIGYEGDYDTTTTVDHWLTCGKVRLTKQDKQHILGGKELTDLHVNAYCPPTIS